MDGQSVRLIRSKLIGCVFYFTERFSAGVGGARMMWRSDETPAALPVRSRNLFDDRDTFILVDVMHCQILFDTKTLLDR